MSGPWEQYQTPGHADVPSAKVHGPWEQYANQAAVPRKVPPVINEAPLDPTDGMSAYEKFMAGVGRSVAETWRGLKKVGGAIGDAIPGVDLSDFRKRTQQEINEARRIDAPLLDTGWGTAGNIAGYAAQMLVPGVALKATPAARYLLPTTIRGNALQGAVLGALQPTATGESYAENALLGGLGGAAGATAAKLGAGVYRGARTLLTGGGMSSAERAAAQHLLREADDPARLRQAAPSLVPGVQRTLAEETLDPGIARMERTVRSTGKGFTDIDLANNAARVHAIGEFAGDAAKIAAAKQARGAVAARYLQEITAAPSQVDNAMQALDSGHEFMLPKLGYRLRKSGTGYMLRDDQSQATLLTPIEARRVLSATGLSDASIPHKIDMTGMQDQLNSLHTKYTGNSQMQSAINTIKGEVAATGGRMDYLENARQSAGDLITRTPDGTMRRLPDLIQAKDIITDQMRAASPSFAQYLDHFQSMSAPINRMQIGQDLLLPTSGGATRDVLGNQVLTPAQFSKKARNLDAVAAHATDFPRAKAADILQPSDIATIKAIQDDLERQAFRMTAGSGGNSNTFERLGVQDRIARRGASQMLGHVPFVGRFAEDFLSTLEKTRHQRIQERLAYLIANPAEARRVLDALPPAGRTIVAKVLSQLSGMTGGATGTTAATSGQPLEESVEP
ncbi:MAG TPA: hypothetical protein ACQGQG_09795 [Xylella sp.]